MTGIEPATPSFYACALTRLSYMIVTNEDVGTLVVSLSCLHDMPHTFCLSHLCYSTVLQDHYSTLRLLQQPIELIYRLPIARLTLYLPFENT